jgi:hypothetical protein
LLISNQLQINELSPTSAGDAPKGRGNKGAGKAGRRQAPFHAAGRAHLACRVRQSIIAPTTWFTVTWVL